MRVVYAGRLHGEVLTMSPGTLMARVRFDNGTIDWFRSDLMVPEGEHDPQEPTPGAWRDRAGFLWLEAAEPGSRQVFCYDAPVRRRMGDKWPVQPLEEAEAEFGPMERMVPEPQGPQETADGGRRDGLETWYMLQFRRTDGWVSYWDAPVPLEAVESMGGFDAVLGLVPGPVRLVAWIPGVVASAE